jgi:hypothetical protein
MTYDEDGGGEVSGFADMVPMDLCQPCYLPSALGDSITYMRIYHIVNVFRC